MALARFRLELRLGAERDLYRSVPLVGPGWLGSAGLSFSASLKPRMPSPNPLPRSANLEGPKTRRAITKITSRCIGCAMPSNIQPPKSNEYALVYYSKPYFRRFVAGRRYLISCLLFPCTISASIFPHDTISLHASNILAFACTFAGDGRSRRAQKIT